MGCKLFLGVAFYNGLVALSREKILDTAFDLLSRYGLADLSMRRLATELGVAPGALYYHVKNKQELLASLASRMVRGVEFSGSTAQHRLLAGARELYAPVARVRESAEVIRLALALHAQKLVFVTVARDIFAAEGLDDERALLAAKTLLHVCVSMVEEEQTRALLAGTEPAELPTTSYLDAARAIISGWLE